MDREHGAREACEFVQKLDFAPSSVAFDAAFDEGSSGAVSRRVSALQLNKVAASGCNAAPPRC